jgi:hypothetical protein
MSAKAKASIVYYEGVAYSGNYQKIKTSFPYIYGAIKSYGSNIIQKQFFDQLKNKSFTNFKLHFSSAVNTNHFSTATTVALVFNSENISVEKYYGGLYKLMIYIRAEAMFFNYKTKTVTRVYPIDMAYIDALNHRPTRKEKLIDTEKLLFSRKHKNINYYFYRKLKKASLPTDIPRYIQVTSISIKPGASNFLHLHFHWSDEYAKTKIADEFTNTIAKKDDVPMLPYRIDYSIDRSRITFMNGNSYNLKIPVADYDVKITLNGFKRILYGSNSIGKSYIYGAFVHIKILEPLSGDIYLNSNFKNGVIQVIPVSQESVDKVAGYKTALLDLFNKLGDVLNGAKYSWIKEAASAPDIIEQIHKTRRLLNSCK